MELKAGSLAQSRDDASFLAAFRMSTTVKTGEFPPAALVELYHEPEATAARLRRLHMVIVDLCHPRKTPTRTEKQFYQQISELRNDFFFLRVPCALEALTVINPLVEIVHSHA